MYYIITMEMKGGKEIVRSLSLYDFTHSFTPWQRERLCHGWSEDSFKPRGGKIRIICDYEPKEYKVYTNIERVYATRIDGCIAAG